MASPMNARPLSTTYVPTTAQTVPTMTAAARARRKKACASGSSRKLIASPPPCAASRAVTIPTAAFVEMPFVTGCLVVVMRVVEHHGVAAQDQQMPAVRRGQDGRVQHERRRAVGNDRPVDRGDALKALGGAG